MAKDPELLAHQRWLGYLQPVGLVVSPPALLQAQAHVNQNVAAEHQRFLGHVTESLAVGQAEPIPAIVDLRALLRDVFGWQAADLVEAADPRAAALEVVLPVYQETLRPTFAVPEDSSASTPNWLLLIQQLPLATPLDDAAGTDERHWKASPQARFERLLRETQVPIGLLYNSTHLRLVFAPRGETAGHLTFPVKQMTEVAGRPIFSALLMLLSQERLFTLPDKQRLPSILAESRKYQNTVSTELARQVLAALYELLRGFQAADDLRKGELLLDVLAREPDSVYAGLLTVLLRLVFLLYAEDRGLMSDDEVYVRHYSVTGLFERLREDDGRYPDTMDLRYGAWAQLLTLFGLVHDGARHGKLHLPARHGYLFQPDRYPFLEGRPLDSLRQPDQRLNPPHVADGVIFRVLRNLLLLDAERISYRTLDVEQIGSVYETIMGFRLERATDRSVAVKPVKTHGAPVTINLDALLQVPAKDRGKWLKEQTDQAVTGAALNALKAADSPEAVVAALERKLARDLTPNIMAPGGMVLQPSDERRRSGSHYTPRSLTEPIVRKALEPVLKQLGERPTPQQILDIKVCDPAKGSGAFLVEACRQLADVLVTAWHAHDCLPRIPPDEDEVLHARRVVAQRCLYGVDKNAMASNLAKLSLWLATLAKDHPFTFLDHALRCGDSLVGLGQQEILRFHWKPGEKQMLTGQEKLVERVQAATHARQEILEAGDEVPFTLKQQKLAVAEESLGLVRFAGNLVVAAFFAGANDRQRQARRDALHAQFTEYLRTGDLNQRPTAAEKALLAGDKGITPFHWEIEFPEVFGRENGGFDAMVGNPPFVGGRRIRGSFGSNYLDWLASIHSESSGNADLVAHFFRRAFVGIRAGGCFGLLATNTIGQGDTRSTGLRWICKDGGTIYSARKRYKWPGQAAVVVSVVHVCRGSLPPPYLLDATEVGKITAFLFHSGGNDDPEKLDANRAKSFQGSIVLGLGFTFDDEDSSGTASPVSLVDELVERDPRNKECVFPYIGGEESNTSPTHQPHRFVISFAGFPLRREKLAKSWSQANATERAALLRTGIVPKDYPEPVAADWPDLLSIVDKRVRPERTRKKGDGSNVLRDPLPQKWWIYADKRPTLYSLLSKVKRALVISQTSKYVVFAFLPSNYVFSHKTVVFPQESFAWFAQLQSRAHQEWADFQGS